MKFLDDRPIVACSTGSFANTAISIVRLSGFKNLSDLQSIFDFDLKKTKPRYNHLVNIVSDGQLFDNCLLCFFPSHSSFTGENVLELSVHGNLLNVDRILQIFINKFGFRHADPGEFSFRAYKNKKLSLSQIEGLDLFLNASNSLMLEQGLDVLQGQLHQSYLKLFDIFLKLKSSVELLIDFSEDVGEEYAREMYAKHLSDFQKLVLMLSSRCEGNFSSLMNPEVVIVGETNAGKSSFFNNLLKNDRSIVSNIKGTTRDYISEVISHRGNNFVLVDTAGIRETFDEIEKIGISRSYEKIKHGFFKILLINPFEFDPNLAEKFKDIVFDLIIFSHSDLSDFPSRISKINLEFFNYKFQTTCSFLSGSIGPIIESGSIGPKNKSGPIGPKNETGSMGPTNGTGSIGPVNESGSIGPVIETGSIGAEILKLIDQKYSYETSNKPILLERHRIKIRALDSYLNSNFSNIKQLDDLAITSSEINRLGNELVELIGQVSSEDVLNSVFANFCIGK